MKIWFLTRSFYPYYKTGGAQMRLWQVNELKNLGWDIQVIMPNYGSSEFNIDGNIIRIPFRPIRGITYLFERVGIYEDYLDRWVETAFDYLQSKVKKEDILFATTGGDLGTVKLGSLLQKKIGCKFIVNYRDPINYTTVHGLIVNNRFHINRDRVEKKYIQNSNLIVTSSESNGLSLQKKYPYFKDKIVNNYFGYMEKIDLNKFEKEDSNCLRIAYVGTMSETQKPEILYEAYRKLTTKENIKIYFIGNTNEYEPLRKVKDNNVIFIDFMPHDEFMSFMVEVIDVGFVSLARDYFGACVPGKIYEYINLGLPMIGALPDGDGKDIINNFDYGIACKYDDLNGIMHAIEKFQDLNYMKKIKSSLLTDRDKWSMQTRIKNLDMLLKRL